MEIFFPVMDDFYGTLLAPAYTWPCQPDLVTVLPWDILQWQLVLGNSLTIQIKYEVRWQILSGKEDFTLFLQQYGVVGWWFVVFAEWQLSLEGSEQPMKFHRGICYWRIERSHWLRLEERLRELRKLRWIFKNSHENLSNEEKSLVVKSRIEK